MAVEGCISRVSGRLAEAALRLRRPARRFVGSLRSATYYGAVIVGGYNLTMGCFLLDARWSPCSDIMLSTSASFCFITTIMDIALIFGLLIRDDKVLKYILCAAIAVYTMCVPLAVSSMISLMVCSMWETLLWEIFRIGTGVLNLGVLYCLLAELRGDIPPEGAPSSPPVEGWLKNNLARAPPGQVGGDEALLKVQAGLTSGPAVLAPSSCTTAVAAPLHHPSGASEA